MDNNENSAKDSHPLLFMDLEILTKGNTQDITNSRNWDFYRINLINNHCGLSEMIFLTTFSISEEDFKQSCKKKSLYRSNILIYKDKSDLKDKIEDYVEKKSASNQFMIVSHIDFRSIFHDKAILYDNTLDLRIVFSKLCRIESDFNDYFSWSIHSIHGEEDDYDEIMPFYKVIFLDIDGVLNNESDGPEIDLDMVNRLGRIVEETNADVVLSSSWKLGYKSFIEDGYKSYFEKYTTLYTSLKNVGITIRGITPLTSASGPAARPYEIREWLHKYHQIFSYVILEDDTFWDWGFLQRNVVTTQTKVPSTKKYSGYKYIKGLTDEHVEKAIAILNDRGAMLAGYWNVY